MPANRRKSLFSPTDNLSSAQNYGSDSVWYVLLWSGTKKYILSPALSLIKGAVFLTFSELILFGEAYYFRGLEALRYRLLQEATLRLLGRLLLAALYIGVSVLLTGGFSLVFDSILKLCLVSMAGSFAGGMLNVTLLIRTAFEGRNNENQVKTSTSILIGLISSSPIVGASILVGMMIWAPTSSPITTATLMLLGTQPYILPLVAVAASLFLLLPVIVKYVFPISKLKTISDGHQRSIVFHFFNTLLGAFLKGIFGDCLKIINNRAMSSNMVTPSLMSKEEDGNATTKDVICIESQISLIEDIEPEMIPTSPRGGNIYGRFASQGEGNGVKLKKAPTPAADADKQIGCFEFLSEAWGRFWSSEGETSSRPEVVSSRHRDGSVPNTPEGSRV